MKNTLLQIESYTDITGLTFKAHINEDMTEPELIGLLQVIALVGNHLLGEDKS